MNHITQIKNNFAACVQSVRHQHAYKSHDGGRATGQSQPRWRSFQNQLKFAPSVFAGHRRHKSLICTRIATYHPNFIIHRSISMKHMTHLMQFSLVISHCNITFSPFQLSQGSAATLVSWCRWSLYRHVYRSSLNLTVKTALKSVDFSRSYRQK